MSQYRTKGILTTIIVMFTVLMLTACGGAAAPTATPAPDQVTLQLSWIHNSVWSGFYEAVKQNRYADEHINVDLKTVFDDAGKFLDVGTEVTSGHATFGIMSGDALLSARAAGQPLVAVASLYQRHPLALVSLAAKGITRPQDLIGKTAQISPNSSLIFEALLKGQGIDPAQVNIVTRTDFSITPLTSGEADVIDAWVTNEVPILQIQNVAYNAIYPNDYGIEVYPNVIVATQDTISNKPDLVARFIRATLKGIQDTIDNPAQAAQYSLDYNKDLNLAQEQKAVEQSLPLLNPAGSHPGMMNSEVWQFTEQTLLDQGILKSALDTNAAFTLQFLNQIYTQ